MSRTETRPIAPGVNLDILTPEEKAKRETFSNEKFSKGPKRAAERANELFGISISEHFIRRATYKNKLAYNVIAHCVHYSDQQLYDFLVLSTRRNVPSPVA
jgi:hypothetical protein